MLNCSYALKAKSTILDKNAALGVLGSSTAYSTVLYVTTCRHAALCGSRGSCVKFDEVRSRDSGFGSGDCLGLQNCRFENEKNLNKILGCGFRKIRSSSYTSPEWTARTIQFVVKCNFIP